MSRILHSSLAVLTALFTLSACFNAETTLTFNADETVTSKSALILDKEIVALSEMESNEPAFCIEPNEIREDHPKGVSCAMVETRSLASLLDGAQVISFGGQMMEEGQDETDMLYTVSRQNDGSYIVSFDLSDLKEAADEQATGGEDMDDEEMQQIIAMVKALFIDSGFAIRVSAPTIISTNGEMVGDNTAEYRFSIADMFDDLKVPNSFDVTVKLN